MNRHYTQYITDVQLDYCEYLESVLQRAIRKLYEHGVPTNEVKIFMNSKHLIRLETEMAHIPLKPTYGTNNVSKFCGIKIEATEDLCGIAITTLDKAELIDPKAFLK